ncbi:hypothetical protein C7M84_018237 [Penaeus vannamei]|uniref:Uncharacterized protein n=1 Tax=Penaeus vannamei TaxID=6689 RepID=A0A423SHZ2_PENVA|nr:hypothetical protein C7M84_018237 [Penaeus vannamei]
MHGLIFETSICSRSSAAVFPSCLPSSSHFSLDLSGYCYFGFSHGKTPRKSPDDSRPALPLLRPEATPGRNGTKEGGISNKGGRTFFDGWLLGVVSLSTQGAPHTGEGDDSVAGPEQRPRRAPSRARALFLSIAIVAGCQGSGHRLTAVKAAHPHTRLLPAIPLRTLELNGPQTKLHTTPTPQRTPHAMGPCRNSRCKARLRRQASKQAQTGAGRSERAKPVARGGEVLSLAQSPFQPASPEGSAGGGAWDCRGFLPFSPQGEKNRKGLSRREGKAAKGGRHSETIPNVKRGAVACVKGRTTADTGGGGTGTGYPGGPRSASWREPATFAVPGSGEGGKFGEGTDARAYQSTGRSPNPQKTPHTPGRKNREKRAEQQGTEGERSRESAATLSARSLSQHDRKQGPSCATPGRGRPPHAPPHAPVDHPVVVGAGRLSPHDRGAGAARPRGPGKAAPPTAPAARTPPKPAPLSGTGAGEAGASSRRRGPRRARRRLRPRPERAQGAESPSRPLGGEAQPAGGPRTARARPPTGPDGELAARPPAAAEGGPPYSCRHGPSAHTTAGRGRSAPGPGKAAPPTARQPGPPKACPAFGDGSRRGRGFLAAAGATPGAPPPPPPAERAQGARPNQQGPRTARARPRPVPTASSTRGSPPARPQPKVAPPIVVAQALSHHDRAQGPPSAARQGKTAPSGGDPGRAAPVPYAAAHGPRGRRGPKGESPASPCPRKTRQTDRQPRQSPCRCRRRPSATTTAPRARPCPSGGKAPSGVRQGHARIPRHRPRPERAPGADGANPGGAAATAAPRPTISSHPPRLNGLAGQAAAPPARSGQAAARGERTDWRRRPATNTTRDRAFHPSGRSGSLADARGDCPGGAVVMWVAWGGDNGGGHRTTLAPHPPFLSYWAGLLSRRGDVVNSTM